jgi:hypothetical protein
MNATNETIVLVITLAGDKGNEQVVAVTTTQAVYDAYNDADGNNDLLDLAVKAIDADSIDDEDEKWLIVGIDEIDSRVAALASHLGKVPMMPSSR